MDYTYEVLVVGGGPAGMAAAERAAELGARTAVVERSALGGTCLNSGCVPTRVLAKTARLYREVRTAFDYGIVVQEPTVDWKKTVTRVDETVHACLAASRVNESQEISSRTRIHVERTPPDQASYHQGYASWL
jgi:pyruvate/2-oxoglutarate dehydrogenase complex dihydrolipoamide dehydrogenase (E3) component